MLKQSWVQTLNSQTWTKIFFSLEEKGGRERKSRLASREMLQLNLGGSPKERTNDDVTFEPENPGERKGKHRQLVGRRTSFCTRSPISIGRVAVARAHARPGPGPSDFEPTVAAATPFRWRWMESADPLVAFCGEEKKSVEKPWLCLSSAWIKSSHPAFSGLWGGVQG